MKIGLVRRGYSPTGGAEKYLHRLIVGLERAGHECVLFAGPEWPVERRPAGGLVSVAGLTPMTFADRLSELSPRTVCDRLFSLERVWQCDCYRAGDGVHADWLERRAATESGWHGMVRHFNWKHRQILALEKGMFATQKARSVIANSRLVRDEIVRRYGYPADRISIVYNGLPSSVAHAVTAEDRGWSRASFEVTKCPFVILFAGSGWQRKGLRAAIAAVGALPESTKPMLLVAGRGESAAALDGHSASTRARVRFLGPISGMHSLYAAADLFVLPTYYDPFSNSCLEALAAGLPVVTTKANGFSEIMETGLDGEALMTPGDVPALASAIESWADPARRAEGKDARVEKGAYYSIENNVDQTLAALSRSF